MTRTATPTMTAATTKQRATPPARRLAVASVLPTGKPAPRGMLTVTEVCAELQIAQSTFYEWRTKGTGPRCIKLPNAQLRVRRADLETWLNAREDAA